MKSILAMLVLSFVSSFATADESYAVHNCAINGRVSLKVNLKSKGPEVEAQYWNNKSSRWAMTYLETRYSYANGSARVYSVEALEGSPVAFLELGSVVKALDMSGALVADCQSAGYGGGYGEDYGGMRGDEFFP